MTLQATNGLRKTLKICMEGDHTVTMKANRFEQIYIIQCSGQKVFINNTFLGDFRHELAEQKY